MTKLKKIIIAMAVLLGAAGAQCDAGEDTHPNAPQAPGPERGGQPAQPRQPNPQAGDPGPHLEELKNNAKQDPKIASFVVIWSGERRFYAEWTTEAGQVPQRITQRAQTAKGGWWAKTIFVRPGQTIGMTAGPTDMTRQDVGTAVCYILHQSGAAGVYGDAHTVPRGPCVVSYVIPA